MTTKRIGSIDLDTGEILEGAVLGWMPRPKIKEDFFMAFTQGFEALAGDERIRGRPLIVLIALFSRLDFDNYINITQAELNKLTGLGQANISRALKTLIEAGIIKRGPKSGRIYTYRLNPGYAWRGRAKNLADARKTHLQLVASRD